MAADACQLAWCPRGCAPCLSCPRDHHKPQHNRAQGAGATAGCRPAQPSPAQPVRRAQGSQHMRKASCTSSLQIPALRHRIPRHGSGLACAAGASVRAPMASLISSRMCARRPNSASDLASASLSSSTLSHSSSRMSWISRACTHRPHMRASPAYHGERVSGSLNLQRQVCGQGLGLGASDSLSHSLSRMPWILCPCTSRPAVSTGCQGTRLQPALRPVPSRGRLGHAP